MKAFYHPTQNIITNYFSGIAALSTAIDVNKRQQIAFSFKGAETSVASTIHKSTGLIVLPLQ